MLRLNIYRIHLPVGLETFIHKLVKYQSNSISDMAFVVKIFEDDYSGIFFQKIILNTQNFVDDQTHSL